ncbi:MAG: hypothetical protein R3A50_16840 [Saprospiraceae bacterium]
MKPIYNLLLLLFCLFLEQTLFSQSIPQGMRYQAVARDLNGNPLQSRNISLLLGIRADDPGGKLVYEEIIQAQTDVGGQFAVTLGSGRATRGIFQNIPWSSAQMWLTIALDENGGNNFKELTASQLWTVPYAFHAGTAANLALPGPSEQSKPCNSTGIPFWTNLGNYNVSDTCHFIGTIFAVDFIFKTNSIERMRITKDGQILISGDLEVENLHVKNDADIDHNLNVDNDASIGNDFSVAKDAAVGQNLSVIGDAKVDMDLLVSKTLTTNNRLVVNGGVSGSDQNINSYPVLVQGSNQGIAVKVNGSRSSANNYMSFWDDNGIQGRIEGQTPSELHNSFEYIWYQTMNSLHAAFGTAIIIADLAGVDDPDAAAVEGFELALAIAEWLEYDINLDNNVGIAFQSGSGDYAEWLEKANPLEQFRFGEVVGVRGGKISLNTKNADHIMVVSHSPIVLGNMPPEEQQHSFEKIAFMGQVPVRVTGKVSVGDYLLASGNHDGLAIGRSPDNMKIEDYDRIIGIAWEASGNPLGGLVNAAVGINANDLAAKVKAQQQELDLMKSQINDLYTKLGLSAPNELTAVEAEPANAEPLPSNGISLTKEEMDRWLDAHHELFENSLNRTKAELEQKGVNISQYPEIAAIYDHPVQYLKKQVDNGYLWEMFEAVRK